MKYDNDDESCDSAYETETEDESDEDSADDSEVEGCKMETVEDIDQNMRLSSAIDDYTTDESAVFSEADLEKWKAREKTLFDKYKNGYYKCKVNDKQVYEQLLTLYKPYITPEALKMIAHPFSTQTNKAMNKSVSAFAPKGKTFSRTESLDTRVGMAGAIQVLGYEVFWDKVFTIFGLILDDNLRLYLRSLQRKKERKREIARSKTGKSRRSRQRTEKLKQDIKQDMMAKKDGTTYETGVAMAIARKGAKNSTSSKVRNPKGTPKQLHKCPYWHPDFCQMMGHSSAMSRECFMFRKSKEERGSAVQRIMEDHIERELEIGRNLGT